ncbi:hypothetical protein THAOC_29121 [Thalassiosira oceanica]|uniref:Uncharacterized protein n=1 Tax=Thalassiosira oceanica TaxID=159749 RepID=K0RER4_THAOC|nr:hypothetical protein THAOC_29121 [Thalassiosira oceanica]|eukprot:EJK51685.1 hypothetical protein THAOC_29121 [Thalassiosira oceanica]
MSSTTKPSTSSPAQAIHVPRRPPASTATNSGGDLNSQNTLPEVFRKVTTRLARRTSGRVIDYFCDVGDELYLIDRERGRDNAFASPDETALTGQDVIGYFSKETMEAELYSIVKDMAMFNPPRKLGAGILD